MKKSEVVLSVVVSLFILFMAGSCIRTVLTCDGHVLRNAFDWPVCVKDGGR